jgi:2-phospho-L-lactate/phosphoenolpyruvate guanylyltransferase
MAVDSRLTGCRPALAYDQPMESQRQPRVVAVIPVGTLDGAKSRLGGTLDAEERRDLATRLLTRTLEAAGMARGIDEILVVTPDDEVREIATRAGARPLRQRSQGLNAGLRQARDEVIAAGADAMLVLPIDLPLVSARAIEATLEPLDEPTRPLVVLVPDRHGRGTNALLLAPPDAIEFGFGGDSRRAHAACAQEANARYVELDGPLSVDVDTPDDLLLIEQRVPEAIDAR